jgi:Xaa-Pro aminopeptidase
MTRTHTAHRLQRLATMIREQEIDALLVSHARNRRYLTGFRDDDDQVDESAGWVVVTADGKATLFCSAMSVGAAEAEVGDATIHAVPAPLADGIVGAVAEHIRALDISVLGFEPHLAWHRHEELAEALPDLSLEAIWGLVEWVRMVKDATEIAAIRRAVAITDAAYAAAIEAMRPGVTEREIAWVIDRTFREQGAEGNAFPTIVAAGVHAAIPHHIPDDTPLRTGESIILDLGAKVDGYCADLTRTVALGHADDHLRATHATVIAGMEAGIAMLKPGVIARDAANTAIEAIRARGMEAEHVLGHGVGLSVHEWPWVSPEEENVTLTPGMFSTAEPGIYDPTWGGVRVEECVEITSEGPLILSKAPRTLVIGT